MNYIPNQRLSTWLGRRDNIAHRLLVVVALSVIVGVVLAPSAMAGEPLCLIPNWPHCWFGCGNESDVAVGRKCSCRSLGSAFESGRVLQSRAEGQARLRPGGSCLGTVAEFV